MYIFDYSYILELLHLIVVEFKSLKDNSSFEGLLKYFGRNKYLRIPFYKNFLTTLDCYRCALLS